MEYVLCLSARELDNWILTTTSEAYCAPRYFKPKWWIMFSQDKARAGFWIGAFEFLIKLCGAVLPSLLGTLDVNRRCQSILSTCCDFCFAALPTYPMCSRCFCTLTISLHCEWLPDGRCCNPGFLFGELRSSPMHDSPASPCLHVHLEPSLCWSCCMILWDVDFVNQPEDFLSWLFFTMACLAACSAVSMKTAQLIAVGSE